MVDTEGVGVSVHHLLLLPRLFAGLVCSGLLLPTSLLPTALVASTSDFQGWPVNKVLCKLLCLGSGFRIGIAEVEYGFHR